MERCRMMLLVAQVVVDMIYIRSSADLYLNSDGTVHSAVQFIGA